MWLTNFDVKLKDEMDLYTRAKLEQWDAERDVNWNQDFQWEKDMPIETSQMLRHQFVSQNFFLEQLSRNESANLISMLPDMEAQLFASVHAVDETRHVEVMGRYASRLGGIKPMNEPLAEIVGWIDSLQEYEDKIMAMYKGIEGFLLSAYRHTYLSTPDPLLKSSIGLIIRDEGRHNDFGLVYMGKKIPQLSKARKKQLEETAQQLWRLLRSFGTFDDSDIPQLPEDSRAKRDAFRESILKETGARMASALETLSLHFDPSVV